MKLCIGHYYNDHFNGSFFMVGPYILVLREEFDKYKIEQSEFLNFRFKGIDEKLDLILTGQHTLQRQYSAQNVINEQFKEHQKDVAERLRYLERQQLHGGKER